MIGVVVVAVFANVAWGLNHHYATDQAFWKHGVETNPIHTNLSALGDVYLRQSQTLMKSAQAADPGLTDDDRTAIRQEAREKKTLAYEHIGRSLEDRKHARGFYRLGELYMEDRNYAEAIPQFEKAIAANRDNKVRELTAGAAYMLGLSHFYLAQYDKAEPAFAQAIEVNPNGFEAHLMLGRVFLRNKQYAKAVNHLETARQLNPTYGAVERYLKSAKTQLTKEQ
jgi:tetratricopeptide (TPR) repeat protein